MNPEDPKPLSTEREADGRWLAEDKDHPGVMAYGKTQAEAEVAVRELAERVAPNRAQECVRCGSERLTHWTLCHRCGKPLCSIACEEWHLEKDACWEPKPEVAQRVAEKSPDNAQEKLIVTPDEKMKEKLRKYPGPFSVNNFVDKYEVHDANGSECRGIAGLIEWALNRAREEEPV